MKIRMKVLLSALISLTAAAICTIIIVRALLVGYIENEEISIVQQNYHRSVSILQREEDTFEKTQKDWAQWDDAYQFIADRNTEFISANLQQETLEVLKLNLMIFLDKDYCIANNNVTGLVAESDDAIIEDLLNNVKVNRFFEEPSDNKSITGITMLGGYPMFISFSPLTTTDGTAPGNGFLIIGKYVNQSFINYMEDVLQVKINIASTQNQKSTPTHGSVRQITAFCIEDIKIEKNESNIKSYTEIDDILNNQSITIEFDLDRKLYRNGINAVNYFGVIFLIALLIVASLCIWVFDRLITQRIGALHTFVDKVTASKDTTSRISENGKDEISRLAANMNNMFGELDRSYAELKKREERFRLIMETTNDGYFDINLVSNEIYISPSWLNYLGYKENGGFENYQKYLNSIFPEDKNVFESELNKYLQGEAEHFKVKYRVVNSTGEWLWTVARGRIVEIDENRKALRLIGTISDITEKMKYEVENLYLIQTDPITTLKNRAYMESMLKKADQCSECIFWIIMGDVNGLKIVNDSFGHQEGDSLLRTIGEILEGCCSDGDIPARWGGDEFLILVKGRDAIYVENLIQRIKTECEQVVDYPFKISIAMGSAGKDEKHSNSDAILKLAEERMYRNKLLESRSTRSAIIFSLEQSLHEKHIETEEHTKRIEHMCVRVGEKLELSQEELDELALLGVLHDIGKIAIPESILLKPGKLTHEEWEIMKTHTEIGYRIAASTPELAHIADEILYHHERYDGTGYPQGLAGENIPKLSRLLAIVDSFDVMTHDREYKKAMSLENAVIELKNCSGTQFDQEMVEAFLRLLEEHLFDINIEE